MTACEPILLMGMVVFPSACCAPNRSRLPLPPQRGFRGLCSKATIIETAHYQITGSPYKSKPRTLVTGLLSCRVRGDVGECGARHYASYVKKPAGFARTPNSVRPLVLLIVLTYCPASVRNFPGRRWCL